MPNVTRVYTQTLWKFSLRIEAFTAINQRLSMILLRIPCYANMIQNQELEKKNNIKIQQFQAYL